MAIGAKKIETRSWATGHKGLIAIHAAKKFRREERALCMERLFWDALNVDGKFSSYDLPLGAIVAVATLRACLPTDRHIAYPERAFGDYSDGRWMFYLDDVKALREPIPCRGMLGLWTVPADVLEAIDAQIGVSA